MTGFAHVFFAEAPEHILTVLKPLIQSEQKELGEVITTRPNSFVAWALRFSDRESLQGKVDVLGGEGPVG